MVRWVERSPLEVPAALLVAVGGQVLLAQTLARRGLVTPEAARAFLDPAAYVPSPPSDLPDLELAVERLRLALWRGERIAVWGDFDADGQTATALLLETLAGLGADATFHVPARNEGHGLHSAGLDRLIAAGARLIVTCDTGTSADAAIAHARGQGAEVIVTDHHVPGERLPLASAVVNPHRLPAGHPMATLTGAGVAYELARGLDPVLADRALDLAALGIVADVGTLTGDARHVVQRGIAALRRTSRPGLRAIYEATELNAEGITEEHISFVLGPRLNALGRLADARHGVELLTTADWLRARTLASEVEGLNAQRQWLTKQITDAALAQIERNPSLLNDFGVLVLSQAAWPAGVIGVVAGRLAERFGKPAVLISAPAGELARASGRSVPGVDLIAAIRQCAPLLREFGGHAGAAGFSIDSERIPELRGALSRAISRQATPIPEPELAIDAYLELPQLTLELVGELNRLAPFGPGNPPLTLAVRDLRVLSQAEIGRTGEHRRLTVEDAHEQTMTVFWWQGAGWPLPQGRFDLAVALRSSDYRGLPEVQVEWIDAHLLEPEVPIRTTDDLKIQDLRSEADPVAVLVHLAQEGDLQIWAEGRVPGGIEARDRHQLGAAKRLAILTLPPGRQEIQAALRQVRPEEVWLFALHPGSDDPASFLNHLGGLVRFLFKARSGHASVEGLAAAMGHRTRTVEAGLEWLAARGQIAILSADDDLWQLGRSSDPGHADRADAAWSLLNALLAETAAFREYARTAPASAVIGG